MPYLHEQLNKGMGLSYNRCENGKCIKPLSARLFDSSFNNKKKDSRTNRSDQQDQNRIDASSSSMKTTSRLPNCDWGKII